jgi:hypothetical protein
MSSRESSKVRIRVKTENPRNLINLWEVTKGSVVVRNVSFAKEWVIYLIIVLNGRDQSRKLR